MHPALSRLLSRVMVAFVPAILLLLVASAAVWGETGIVARQQLADRLKSETEALAAIDRENARLLRELDLLGSDPLLVERAAAEEIGWARKGTTIYRFEDPRPAR
ncbi:MAG: septum formation initiator family protein [Deltaproteobacteria bacterium]|nr:septum formation initiator family protein [Deltaproteobacteria bacterium]